jgi:hypothetical protein
MIRSDVAISVSELQALKESVGTSTSRLCKLIGVARATWYRWVAEGGISPNSEREIMAVRRLQDGTPRTRDFMTERVASSGLRPSLCVALDLHLNRYKRCRRQTALETDLCYQHLRLLKEGTRIVAVTGRVISVEQYPPVSCPARVCMAILRLGGRCTNEATEIGFCAGHRRVLQQGGTILTVGGETWTSHSSQ